MSNAVDQNSFASTAARTFLALTIAMAIGAASGSRVLMISAFAMSLFVLHLGWRVLISAAQRPWSKNPAILVMAILSSITSAAWPVMAFGVLLAGHVALNMVLLDFGMQELDFWVGILPFIGFIAYGFAITYERTAPERRTFLRALVKGVMIAGTAAVVLYMLHAVIKVTGIG